LNIFENSQVKVRHRYQKTVGKFVIGVIDNGGKFAASVNKRHRLNSPQVANFWNNGRLLRPLTELEGKNVSIS
jgi:hypothetical protein